MTQSVSFQNINSTAFAGLLTALNQRTGVLYSSHKEKQYSICLQGAAHLSGYQPVPLQKIAELAVRFETNLHKDNDAANQVSLYLNREARALQKLAQERSPLARVANKIWESVRNFFKGHGLRTTAAFALALGSRLAKAQPQSAPEAAIPVERPPEERVLPAPLALTPPPAPESAVDFTLPVIQDLAPKQEVPVEEERADTQLPAAPSDALPQRAPSLPKLTRGQSMNFSRKFLELRTQQGSLQFKKKLDEMAETRQGIFYILQLEEGEGANHAETRADLMKTVFASLDHAKRMLVVAKFLDDPDFKPDLIKDCLSALDQFDPAKKLREMKELAALLRTYVHSHESTGYWQALLSEEQHALLYL